MLRVVFNFAEAAANDGATFLASRNRLRSEESMPILVRRRWSRKARAATLGAVILIEKEGFAPILEAAEAAQIAERFNVVIMP
jgi:hypothetical protein